MKSNNLLSIILFTVLLVACGQGQPDYSEAMNIEEVAETPEAKSIFDESDEQFENQGADLLRNLKIIKNANCRFKVSNVDSITDLARGIVLKHQGYISDMRFQHTSYELENRFTVRIPQQHFEIVMQQLTDLAEFVDFKNITTTDVSEEYIDLQARLKTKEEVKTRYTEILRNKAKTVEEVLLTEEKIRVLQEEIEVAQGRLKFVSNKVALSTIQVDLYETVAHKEQPESYTKTFGSKAKEGLGFGWDLLEGIFLAILYIWPLLLLTTGAIVYIRYRRRK